MIPADIFSVFRPSQDDEWEPEPSAVFRPRTDPAMELAKAFVAEIENPHSRAAYEIAVKKVFRWMSSAGLDIYSVSAPRLAQYFDEMKRTSSAATVRQNISAVRRFFDKLVVKGILIANPTTGIRGDRQIGAEGKTPEIALADMRAVLESIDISEPVGARDRAILLTMASTGCRVGAVAKLRRGDLLREDGRWLLRLHEKRSKTLTVRVRPELLEALQEYLSSCRLAEAPAGSPFFRAAAGATYGVSENPVSVVDVCRMLKRRLVDAGLPTDVTPHSFRVAAISNLLRSGVPLRAVQELVGHADPRSTEVYDRSDHELPEDVVGKIPL